MSKCSICNSASVKMQMSCCSKESAAEGNIITDYNDPCCELTIVDKKLSDKFFFSQNNSKEEIGLISILIENADLDHNNFSLLEANKFINESPPGLLTNHLYLNLSVILI